MTNSGDPAPASAPILRPGEVEGPYETEAASKGHQSFWLWVMCLTGVDYFSTLAYQPSIAYESLGRLAPLGTIALILVTLLGALPVYSYVASRSPHGLGSIGMLERITRGWTSKFLVLILLGFAATDFVITKTLSAADATEHLLANPLWPEPGGWLTVDRQRVIVTMFLLVLLGAMFLRGFREVIGLAVGIVAVYLLLNAVIVVSGLVYLAFHPNLLADWYEQVSTGQWEFHSHVGGLGGIGGVWLILLVCLIYFPKLALGLSGFETGVAVMPLIKGDPGDDPDRPQGRIVNTRKLLLTAAVIMSVYLMGSALVVSTLIEPTAWKESPAWHAAQASPGQAHGLSEGGAAAPRRPVHANERALAFLAHRDGERLINPLFGPVFGTVYDLSTVIILWFAGASAMAGLLNLVPQYLPRYGMAPDWARNLRPLVILFTAINLFITWWFSASVKQQSGAYATGVLVLITSACLATVIGRWRAATGPLILRVPWFYLLILAVFVYTTVLVIVEKSEGLQIAACFVAAILLSSMISRTMRSRELRIVGFQFKDEQSKFLWESLKHLEFPVLVPHRPGQRSLAEKEETIRQEHHLSPEIPIVFVEAELGDVSEFWQEPIIEVTRDGERFIIKIRRCASIAHVLAAVGLELSKFGKPPELHFGWSDESPFVANLDFLLFGEGNVPWMVRELILRAEPNPERQPKVVIG